MDGSCRVQRAAVAGSDLSAPWSCSGLRTQQNCVPGQVSKTHKLRADIPFGARMTWRCPWILAGATPRLCFVALGPLRRLWRVPSVVARLGPRKFEKLYVDGADVLDRRPMGRRSRRDRGSPPGLFLDEPRTRQRWRGPRAYQGVIRSRRAVQASWSV